MRCIFPVLMFAVACGGADKPDSEGPDDVPDREKIEAIHDPSIHDDVEEEEEEDGGGFEVEGLIPVDGDPDGLVGELIFPIDPITGAFHPEVRAEDFSISASLLGGGLPAEVAAAYDRLLPVVVRVDWQTNGVVRRYEVAGLLSPR